MNTDEGFYLTLPSNASSTTYENNTLNHYRTDLPQHLTLTGHQWWEIGLAEIHYPHTWYNVTEFDAAFEIHFKKEGEEEEQRIKAILDAGYYEDAETLIAAINKTVENLDLETAVVFHYNKITQKVTIALKPDVWISMLDGLKDLLGFKQRSVKDIQTGDYVVDLSRGFYSLYVYSDLVEPRIVGDSMVPLLRIVPIQGTHGSMAHRTFENVHYFPLRYKNINTVEIHIRDDTGQLVPFERGKVMVTLHLRPRKATRYLF